MLDAIDRADKWVTHGIYAFTQRNKWFDTLVTYGGLVPYEMYVLPGMALAIVHATLQSNSRYTSLRFHIVPHVFAFSFAGLIKTMVRRPRPGCHQHGYLGYSEMVAGFEQRAKCKHPKGGVAALQPWSSRHGFPYVSFPSGHATVACAVVTGLVLYLLDDTEPKWTPDESKNAAFQAAILVFMFGALFFLFAAWKGHLRVSLPSLLWVFGIGAVLCLLGTIDGIGGVDMNDKNAQGTVICAALGVAFLVSMHRIAKGYHHVLDSIAGAFIGFCVGVFVYKAWPTAPAGDAPSEVAKSSSPAPLESVPRHVIGGVAGIYLMFFFAYELQCFDATAGCALTALAKAEH